MTRRKQNSPLDDAIELVSLMPWWVGLGLAVVAYLVLSSIANGPLPSATPGQGASHLMTASLWRGLAMAGQFLVPLVCVIGAIVSAVRRHQRKTLANTVSHNTAADALDHMSWREFEMLVGEGFQRRGYTVKETGGGGADGGIDLVLGKDGEKFLVQCKQWKAFKVGVSVVRELYGVMAAQGAAGGFVVTSGRFTEDAIAFAKGRHVHLVDGPALMQLLREGRSKPQTAGTDPAPARTSSPVLQPHAPSSPSPSAPPRQAATMAEAPSCPQCGKSMVQRVARRGASAGKGFWGCSDFANGCRGTREIRGF